MWYIVSDAQSFNSKEELIKELNNSYFTDSEDEFLVIEGKEHKVSSESSWFIND